jgi:hypothetical protein
MSKMVMVWVVEEEERDIRLKVAALASQDTCNAQSW